MDLEKLVGYAELYVDLRIQQRFFQNTVRRQKLGVASLTKYWQGSIFHSLTHQLSLPLYLLGSVMRRR